MSEFRDSAGSNDDGTRYGRFGVALDRPAGMLLPRWSVYVFRGDLHQWQYAGVRFIRKLTAMRVAQAMFLADVQHWGPREVQ